MDFSGRIVPLKRYVLSDTSRIENDGKLFVLSGYLRVRMCVGGSCDRNLEFDGRS